MTRGLSNVGKSVQVRVTLDKTKVDAIENTGRSIGDSIRSYIDYLYSTISKDNVPVMENTSPVKKPTMSLTELVYDTARTYLKTKKLEDVFVRQECIFTEGQRNAIFELVTSCGEQTTIESVTTILSGFKL